MDYDDNDFQSQNFQIIGDENKFPPSLRSFALPKYDLDEHLQVQLRFDSLVDTDAFFGIQGQDTNWIENFSSGTSAIEFSSTAADNCSISRHNNVWSEATSSESVEMLLKSVGEDEMKDKKSITMEASAQNQLSGVIYDMDRVGDDASLKEDIIKGDPSGPPDKVERELLVQERYTQEHQPPVKDMSQNFNTEISSTQLDTNSSLSKVQSPGNFCVGQGTMDENATIQSDDMHKRCSLSSETLCTVVSNDETLTVEFMKASEGCGWDSRELAKGDPEPNTSKITEEHLIGEQTVINVSGKSPLLSDDVQNNAKQVLQHAERNELLSDDHEPHLCGRESSFLEPTRNSLVLTSERYNEPEFSGNPDGLLEAIAYQGKAFNHDNRVGNISLRGAGRPALRSEAESFIQKGYVDISEENNPIQTIDVETDHTSETTANVNPSINMSSETLLVETKIENSSEVCPSNAITQTPKSDLEEKNVRVETVAEVNETGSKLVGSGSSLPTALNDAEFKVSTVPDKLNESNTRSDVSTFSHEVSAGGKDKGPSTPVGTTDSIKDVVIAKAEASRSSGKIVDNIGKDGVPPAHMMVHDESGSGLHSLEECLNNDELHPSGSLVSNEVGVSPLKGDSEVSLTSEPVFVTSDPISTNCSPPRELAIDVPDLVPQQDGGVNSNLGSSVITEPNEKEAKVSSPCLMKSEGQVDNRTLDVIDETSPLSNSAEPVVTVEQPSSIVETSVASHCETSAEKPVIHEGTTVVGDDSVKSGTNLSTKSPKDSSEAPSIVVETGKHSLPESSCGSPTIISCRGHSQDDPDGSRGSSVKIDPSQSGSSIKSATVDSKEGMTAEEDRSFTFKVGITEDLSGKVIRNQWKPLPAAQSSEVSKADPLEMEGLYHDVDTKAANQVKLIRASRSSNERASTPRGKSAKGSSSRKKTTDKVGRSCSTSSTPVGAISGMQPVEIKPYTHTENNMKPSASPNVQASGLPDLNSSTTLFQQPFTDLQQVQLRAQIFVYGSLIQGIPPDEACMQSAFGEADAGRVSWETVWRKSVERYQSQKSPVSSETPLQSAVRAPEQLMKASLLQSNAVSTSAGRSVAKVIAPATLSTPLMSSPLWSISSHDGLNSNFPRGAKLDFDQALSPLHSHPSSQTRQLASNGATWQQNPRPGPWAMSALSPSVSAATQYSAAPVFETVQVTPVRDSSMPRPASVQLVSPSTLLPTPGPASVIPSTSHLEPQRNTGSPGNKDTSKSPKPRKRKKAAAAEDVAETIPVSTSEPAAISTKSPPTSQGLLFTTNIPAAVMSGPTVSAPMHIPTGPMMGSGNAEQRVIFSEETCNKVEQAKRHAEDAAAIADSVCSHSQGIWNQLAAQRNSGLVTEVEEKLASAAVAAAAAASVARAAAAAAKVASEAALQAKMMADEALDTDKAGSLMQSSEASFDARKNLAMLTPGSILKGKDKTHGPSSIISAAREATKRRVQQASAAAKRAENLDAIMKAAEMAAEAVSQVGAIISMGDPLPFSLSDLVEAGPDGCWRGHRQTPEKLNKENSLPGKENENLDHRVYLEQTCNSKETNSNIKESITVQGGGVGNSSTLLSDDDKRDQFCNLKTNAIEEGSSVEVISEDDGLRGGWFSARVLDVKGCKAHVCYNNLFSNDGLVKRQEWVSLNVEDNELPRIRLAHPRLGTKSDGNRKRRREAVVSHVWEVGDHVDVWMRDGWWEGIVAEKDQLDETKLVVKFLASGDSSVVRVWDLRPSLTWNNGQWIEWSRERENTRLPHEGDTPQEKRQKVVRHEAKHVADIDSSRIGKLPEKLPPQTSGKEEAGQLNLSAKDKVFSLGKNTSNANISDASRMKRAGQQKEGSKVVIGVPKPGKKRKFMEVSKHYVSDKPPSSQGNESAKFAKYLMPQAAPRAWKNSTKVDSREASRMESKSKRAVDKPVGVRVARPARSQASQSRSTIEKDAISLPAVSGSNSEKNGRGSSSNMLAGATDGDNSEKKSPEVVSFPSSVESSIPVSSGQSLTTAQMDRKKPPLTMESEQDVKGRPSPALDEYTKSEKKFSESSGKAITDTVERRRSNRRIQPTSRLLEGLQSSLIISKIPTISHDRSSKVLNRSSSSRGTTRG